MIKAISGKYFIIDTLSRNNFSATYIAKTISGEKVILKEYFSSGGSGDSLVEICRTLSKAEPREYTLGVKEFFEESSGIYAVSEPVSGVSIKEYMKTSGTFGYQAALSVAIPLLTEINRLASKGVSVTGFDENNIFMSQNKPKILSFGDVAPLDEQRSVFEAGNLIYYMMTGKHYAEVRMPVSGLGITIPPHAESVLMSALSSEGHSNTDFRTLDKFIDALRSFSSNLQPQSHTAIEGLQKQQIPPYFPQTAQPLRHVDYLHKSKSAEASNKKVFQIIIGILIFGFIALMGCISIVTIRLVKQNYSSTSTTWGPMPTIVPLPQPTASSYATSYYDESLNVYYNMYDETVVLNGMVAEYEGVVYYRAKENGEWKFYSDDGKTKTLLLEGYVPSFITVNKEFIFFSDCNEALLMYYMLRDGSSVDCLNESPTLFNTMSSDGKKLFATDHGYDGTLTVWNLDSYRPDYLEDIIAAEMHYYNDRLYYNDPILNSSLFSVDPDNLEDVERHTHSTASNITGYDGYIYYLDKIPSIDDTPNIYSHNLTTAANKPVIKTSTYGFEIFNNSIYYINMDDDYRIYRSDLDGNNAKMVLDCDAAYMKIAGGKIYYVDTAKGEILCRSNLDGSNIEELEDSYE